jgi:chromatin segregation and condensation protein Rec8/ScpA/Scc1 (kleisin family)
VGLAGCPRRGLAAFVPPVAGFGAETEAWCPVTVATIFLAGLELARDGQITLDQPRPWDTIQLHSAAFRADEGHSSV